MADIEQADFGKPDELREFERGRVELVHVAGTDIGRLVLQPGWRWSTHVKPIAGTDYCEAPHFQYHVSGTLHIATPDGVEFDARPGRVTGWCTSPVTDEIRSPPGAML